MSFVKYVAPAAVLASGVYAATCSTSGTLTLTASEQASSLATCQTYSGSIAVATDVPQISIDGPSRVTGDIIVENNDMLSSFSASSLRTIDGALSLVSLSNLQTVSMPQLTKAATFTIQSTGQNLLMLGLSAGLAQVDYLTIADTFLNDISGVSLTTAENVTIANNQLLTELNMPIKNVTGSFSIRGNQRGLTVELANLVDVGALLVNDVSTITVNSLTNSSGLVAFQNNDFKTLNLPNLTIATGGFDVTANPSLTNLTVPKLLAVNGGLNVINNTDLSGVYSFPSLRGAQSMTFQGNFTNVEMPDLVRVPGTGTFVSSNDIGTLCNTTYKSQIAIPKCYSNTSPNPSAVSSLAAGSTKSPNAAMTYPAASPETVFSVFGALAALFGLLM